ncbi:hypothetical protein TRVL_10220 [Trypanosoma vivax]|uniref:Uncharacterized protein n=1 Tax=Trypanosoma vivax (strain Y486) TaxID=1055687 RepID=G0U3L4_TRYVY|nr:hypothetical protein TRVL_10220 [Trypanosoma vivax]CCC50871.1 hypothetical protein, unlikely [Trypanosoma vivax Y486]
MGHELVPAPQPYGTAWLTAQRHAIISESTPHVIAAVHTSPSARLKSLLSSCSLKALSACPWLCCIPQVSAHTFGLMPRETRRNPNYIPPLSDASPQMKPTNLVVVHAYSKKHTPYHHMPT